MELSQLNNSYITREEFRDFKTDVRQIAERVDNLPDKVRHIVSDALEPLLELQRKQNGRVNMLEEKQLTRETREKAVVWVIRGLWGLVGAAVGKIFGLF